MKLTAQLSFRNYLRTLIYSSDGAILLWPPTILLLSWLVVAQPSYNLFSIPALVVMVIGILGYVLNYYYLRKLCDGVVKWNYELTPDVLHLSAGPTKLKLDKRGIRFSRVYRKAVFFKHTKASAGVWLPSDKKNEILVYLNEHGWLEKTRKPFTMLWVYLLLFILSMVITLAALNLR